MSNTKYQQNLFKLNSSFTKNISVTHNSIFLDQTDSTNINNGGMIIKGGVGIAKNLNIGGSVEINNNLSVSQNLNIGDSIKINNNITVENIIHSTSGKFTEYINIGDTNVPGEPGMIKYNTTSSKFEGFTTSWGSLGSADNSNASNASGDFIIQKNLNVSGNAVFNSGISLGSSLLNPAVNKNGTIRYTGTDIEGYISGVWKSLTSGESGNNNNSSGGGNGSSISNIFQLNNITQSFTNLETMIGFNLETTTISEIYIKNFQIFSTPNTFKILEINISHPNLNSNSLSYNLEIYVNNNLSQTVTIDIPQNSVESIIQSITELVIQQNNKLQLKLKANNAVSEGGIIFISLHGENIITTTNIQNNFNISKNLTVSGNGIFSDKINATDLLVSNKIGIGTNNPQYKLDVDGDINISAGNKLRIGGTEFSGGSGGGQWNTVNTNEIEYSLGNVGIGTNNPQYKLDVDGDINISAGNKLRIGGTEFSGGNGGGQWNTVNTNEIEYSLGNVGIGTNNPQYKLDVDGDINISAGNKLRIGGTEFSGSGTSGNTVIVNHNNHSYQQTDQQPVLILSANTGVPISSLDTLIKPTKSDGKIRINCQIRGEWSALDVQELYIYIQRDIYDSGGTNVVSSTSFVSSQGSSNQIKAHAGFNIKHHSADTETTTEEAFLTYIDENYNTTNNIVYRVYIINPASSGSFYLNRTVNNNDDKFRENLISFMEVEQLGDTSVQLASGAGAVINQHNHAFQQTDIQQVITVPQNHTGVPIPVLDTLIIPTSASSTIEIKAQIKGEWDISPNNCLAYLRRDIYTADGTAIESSTELRNTTGSATNSKGISHFLLTYHNNNDSTMEEATIIFYDTPNIANRNVVYRVFIISITIGNIFYLNRTKNNDPNNDGMEATISSMSVEEKGALSVQLASGFNTIQKQEKINKVSKNVSTLNSYIVNSNSETEISEFNSTISALNTNSTIEIDLLVYGETDQGGGTNVHDFGGYLKVYDENGTFIEDLKNKETSYNGTSYNGTGLLGQFMINYYDSNADTSIECMKIKYFYKPNTTLARTFKLFLINTSPPNTTAINFTLNRCVDPTNNQGQWHEKCVSSISLTDDYYNTYQLENPPGVDTKMNIVYKDTSVYRAITIQGNNAEDITELELKITPRSTSSTIKLEGVVNGEFKNTVEHDAGIIIKKIVGGTTTYLRSSTSNSSATTGASEMISPFVISYHLDSFNTGASCVFMIYDTPNTTQEITYIPMVAYSRNSAQIFHFNSTADRNDVEGEERFRSSFSASDDSYNLPVETGNFESVMPLNVSQTFFKDTNTITTFAAGVDRVVLNTLDTIHSASSDASTLTIEVIIMGEWQNQIGDTNMGDPWNVGVYLKVLDENNQDVSLITNDTLVSSDQGLGFFTLSYMNEAGSTQERCHFKVDYKPNTTAPRKYVLVMRSNNAANFYWNRCVGNAGGSELGISSMIITDNYQKTYIAPSNAQLAIPSNIAYKSSNTTATQININANTEGAFFDDNQTYNFGKVIIQPLSTNSVMKITCHVAGEFTDPAQLHDFGLYVKRTQNGVVNEIRGSNSNGLISSFYKIYTDAPDAATTADICDFVVIDDTPFNDTSPVTYQLMYRNTHSSSNQTFYLNTTINSAGETFKSTFLVEDLNYNSYAVEGNNTATTGVLNRAFTKLNIFHDIALPANTDIKVPGLEVLITPKSTTSKIKITVNMCGEFSDIGLPHSTVGFLRRTISGNPTVLNNTQTNKSGFLTANATNGIAPWTIAYHADSGSTMETCNFTFIDEPNTMSEVKYEVMIRTNLSVANAELDLNRCNVAVAGDTSNKEIGVSTIVAEDDYFDVSSIKADSYWENNSTNISYNNGYVGIGTSNPESTLDIKMTYPEYVIINSTDNSGIKIKNDTSTYDSLIYTSGNTLRFHTNGDRMVIREDGNVGIGVTTPNYSLDTLFTTTNTGFTTDTISAIFQTTTGGGKHGVAIGGDVVSGNGFIQTIFNNINFGYNLCLQPHSGNVGIRTISPSYPLHVTGSAGNMPAMKYFNSGSSGLQSGGNNAITIYAAGNIYASSLIAASDSRIKTNIQEIVDNEALIKFRQLKPCKYNYIDIAERGSNEVYGFIAQEVREIMPYASNILPTNQFVPNVYKTALYNNNIITFTENHNLNSNGNIKLILSNNKEITVPYTVVDTLKINIDVSALSDDEKPSNDLVQDEDGNDLAHNIFVYGTEVDDFHTLNKDAIWTTAAAALQEVDRIQQADAVKIQTLESKISILETKNIELETQLTNVLTRLSALENN